MKPGLTYVHTSGLLKITVESIDSRVVTCLVEDRYSKAPRRTMYGLHSFVAALSTGQYRMEDKDGKID